MISQVFELPWDHRNAPVLPLKLATFFLNIKSGPCNNAICPWNFKRPRNRRLQNEMLTIFRGFAMLPLCTKPATAGAAKYRRNAAQIVQSLKAKTLNSEIILETDFS
jgi:hypothetical protein